MRAALLVAVFAVAVPDRPNPKEEPKTQQDQILGEWRVDKFLVGGGLGGLQDLGKHTRIFQITRTEMSFSFDGEPCPDDGLNYTVDWMKNPVAIDMIRRNDPKIKFEAILKLEGDQLTVCFDNDGGRPTDFNIAARKTTALMHLKRVKK